MAETLYQSLLNQGVTAFMMDLDQSAGKKFADMDMMGFPYHILIGSKWLSQGLLDIKIRATGEIISCTPTDALSWMMDRCAPEVISGKKRPGSSEPLAG
jgi:prolyl-tRNA synthetase